MKDALQYAVLVAALGVLVVIATDHISTRWGKPDCTRRQPDVWVLR